MCDTTKFLEKLGELEDFLEFVNTGLDAKMMYEPELYAAYATHHDLSIGAVATWYEEAEDNFVSVYDVELYLQNKYDVWRDEAIDYYYEKEVYVDGTLFECASYWFKTE